jgi:predicted esterase
MRCISIITAFSCLCLLIGCGQGESSPDESADGAVAEDDDGSDANGSGSGDADPDAVDGRPDSNVPEDPTPGATCPTQIEVLPVTDFDELTINGTRVRWVGADTGVGVLFFFHGTGGDVTTWFDRVAGPVIIRDALERGMVVVVFESLDRGEGAQWVVQGAPSQNADIANVKAIMAQLESEGVYLPGTPKFAIGGSNGGSFASHIAQEVDYEGAVIFIARGAAFRNGVATSPPLVVFIPGAEDNQVPPEDIPASITAVEGHGGVAVQWDNTATPLTPDVLSRLPGVSCPQSYSITRAMQTSGLLDDNWMILAEPTLAVLEPLAAFEDSKRVILDQLTESYGGHMVTEEFNAAWLDLFLEN